MAYIYGKVDGLVAYGLADSFDDPLPTDLFDVLCVRDNKPNLIIILLVVPAVQAVANTDMLWYLREGLLPGMYKIEVLTMLALSEARRRSLCAYQK